MAEDLSPNERRFRALVTGRGERIAEIDSYGRTIYFSPNHGDDPTGRPPTLEAVHPEDREAVAHEFAAAFGDGTPRRTTFRHREPDGAFRWAEVTLTPFDAEGGQRHVLVVSRDVSEARETERKLRESREHFQLIAENGYDMISEFHVDGRLLFANDRVREVLGFDPGEQACDIGMVHPDDLEIIGAAFGPVHSGEAESAHAVYRVGRADGSWCWVDGTIRLAVQPDGEHHVVVIARDVTQRVEAESRILESERRYRDLVESAPLGIVVVQERRVVYANPAMATIAGTGDPAQLLGIDVFKTLGGKNSRILAQTVASEGDRNIPRTLDVEMQRADGETICLHATIDRSVYRGAPALQGIIRDVTDAERAERDRRRLELQLQEARKLESLGVLAGGIAHDFNNLLAVILSNVRFAKDDGASAEDRRDALGDAEQAADGASRLVRQMLDYAGRRSPEVRQVELAEVVNSLTGLLASALPREVELELDLQPEPVTVHADLVQLEQVLMNLVLNAAEAVGDQPGKVRVRTGLREISTDELSAWIGGDAVSGGRFALLEVEDTGIGMDEQTRSQVFDPFFSTKVAGHGLGLSAALGLVRGHGGAIQVESEPGEGTCFRIALPLDDPSEPDRSSRRPIALVLVADADEDARQRAAGILGEHGYGVLAAGDAAEALDLWSRHGEEVDVAVLDASVTGALAETFSAARSDLPILETHAADDEAWKGGGLHARLAKPYTPEQLLARIEDLWKAPL